MSALRSAVSWGQPANLVADGGGQRLPICSADHNLERVRLLQRLAKDDTRDRQVERADAIEGDHHDPNGAAGLSALSRHEGEIPNQLARS
jgi:hypothetical protein